MRWFILLVGAALLIAGVAGLLKPVSFTANGTSLGCGNAVISDLWPQNNVTWLTAYQHISTHLAPSSIAKSRCQRADSGRFPSSPLAR